MYAVQYQLESSPPSWRIVWIDEYGESLRPWVRPAHAGKRMAAVNPGDEIVHRGIAYEVAGVWIYRALSQTPGREVVG